MQPVSTDTLSICAHNINTDSFKEKSSVQVYLKKLLELYKQCNCKQETRVSMCELVLGGVKSVYT